jgi:hypothetical protein
MRDLWIEATVDPAAERSSTAERSSIADPDPDPAGDRRSDLLSHRG